MAKVLLFSLVNFLGLDLTNWYQSFKFWVMVRFWVLDDNNRLKKFFVGVQLGFLEELFGLLELVEGFEKKVEQNYYVRGF